MFLKTKCRIFQSGAAAYTDDTQQKNKECGSLSTHTDTHTQAITN